MVSVIKAKPFDIEALQKICKHSYAEVFASHWIDNGLELFLEEQFNENRLSHELISDDYHYFFIRKEDQNIGFLKVKYAMVEQVLDLDNCELEKIYILPNYSGSGVGKTVMKDIIKVVRDCGKKKMYLSVLDTNLSAIAFYKKLGFQYHGKTRLEAPSFKEELRGMDVMCLNLI